MNNNIKYFILGLAVLGGLTACNKQLTEESQAPVNTHRVYFSTATAKTRTGITIEDGTMTPDWRKTQAGNVHLFEMGSKGYAEGEDVKITLSEENQIAHFQADFPTDMTIIVDPSKKTSILTASNEQNDGPYTYAAIVAQATESAYIVPAVQHPDTETLIDPDADFLIGYSRKSYDAAHNWEEVIVDLYFDRPVSLGRIDISSFEEGEKVKSVIIKAPGLSGSVAYTAIDFENAAVTFTPDEATEGETAALTLDYGAGVDLADNGTFGAYFVALPGKAQISEIVVTTDKWVYTKTVDKEITFSKDSFKNLTLNLASATKEAAAPTEIKWYKASVLEDGIDYLIVSEGYALKNNSGTADKLAVTPQDDIITFDSAVDPMIVWKAAAHEEMTGDNGEGGVIAGHYTLKNGDYYLQRTSSSAVGLKTSIPSDKPKYAVWDYDGTYLKHESSATMTFYFVYNNGWKADYTDTNHAGVLTPIQVYTSRAPQKLAFTPAANAEYDLATSEWTVAVPTLSGVQTSVTYALSEDSNPAVATVDEDGTVHPLSRGTVTVVATAAGNDQYQAATASYTLTVISSSVPTKTYRKVTSAAELEIGTQYILVYENDSKVFKPIYDSENNAHYTAEAANALDVVISNGTITSADLETSEMTLESGYHFYVVSEKKYLYPTNSSYNSSCIGAEESKSDSHTFSISISSSGVATISRTSSSSTYSLCYSDYFRGSSSVSANVSLYKLDDGRESQVLSFSPSSVEYDWDSGEPLTIPELSEAHGEVTYSSSNESIASVDATKGTVTVNKTGTVEITAFAAGNTQYKPGSASYTLTITSSKVPKWYLVDEVVGGEYLIVSNGHVLLNDNGTISSEGVSVNNGVIEYDAPTTAIWTVATYGEGYSLTNSDKYLRRSSSTLQIASASGTETNNRWYYNASSQQLTMKGSSSTYYLRYSSSWGLSTSSASAALYSTTPPKLSQELTFSAASVEYDLASGETFSAPTLSGYKTNVTYSSSKPAVATVDAETGAVEIVGVGTTTITASAEGTTEYKPATASYTIHVTDGNAPVTTTRYVLANSIEAGKEYLIVSNGMALQNNNKAEGAYPVTVENSQIELDDDTASSLLWTASADGNRYNFSNGSSFLVRNSNSIVIGDKNSTARYNQWALDDSNHLGAATGGTTLYTLGYDSSSSTWTAKDGNSVNASLYTAE